MANEARGHSAAPEQDAPVWPNGDRRLSDKLLAAHNHAYAAGNRAVANEIRDILALVGGDDEPVHPVETLERARRWIAFVDAREAYEDAVNDVDRGRLQATRLRLHMAQELWRKGEKA